MAKTKAKASPLFLDPPGPECLLAELPDFPAEVAAELGDRHGIRTLSDLRPHVEAAFAVHEHDGYPLGGRQGRQSGP